MWVSQRIFANRRLAYQCSRLLTMSRFVNTRAAGEGFLSESYLCKSAWEKRLELPILQKINVEDFLFELDKKYQSEKVISAIDVDLFVNKISDSETLDEIEEVIHRLRKSPATADSLPSTSHAVIRTFFSAGETDVLMRILNDRMNYGIFIDFYLSNLLMDLFLKKNNYRDAAKIASFLMLEEDFGPPTSKFFSLLSCLKYLENPTPEPWDPPPPVEVKSKDEVKIRVGHLRNPYFDYHFDLNNPEHIVGKTLTILSRSLQEDEVLKRSVELLGLATFDKWGVVETLLKKIMATNSPVAEETVKKVIEMVDKKLTEIESSPTKSLPKPSLKRFPGMNFDKEDLEFVWERIQMPDYSKILLVVKDILTSNKFPTVTSLNLISKTEELLSKSISEREATEIQEQCSIYQEWDKVRMDELTKQMNRFREDKIFHDIQAKKKELEEREDTIFFFDNEEQWMMRQPPGALDSYTLSFEYMPTNREKFVKIIPPKKNRKRKSKA